DTGYSGGVYAARGGVRWCLTHGDWGTSSSSWCNIGDFSRIYSTAVCTLFAQYTVAYFPAGVGGNDGDCPSRSRARHDRYHWRLYFYGCWRLYAGSWPAVDHDDDLAVGSSVLA